MMINCKESALRSSELRDRRIKGMRKLELWYHLLIFKFCRTYDKQIKTLGRFARLIGEASEGSSVCFEKMSDAKLSENARERIKRSLSSP